MWLFYTLFSAFFWGLTNVLDSLLVRRYTAHPFILMWTQALCSICFLFVLTFFFSIHSDWIFVFLLAGILSFVADLWFFTILDHLDISVVNVAWALQSIFLSIGGFFFFHEVWTLLQVLGVFFILLAVVVLSFWHQHVSFGRTLWMLSSLALLYSPNYLLQKYAFVHGQSLFTVFFWIMAGRETCAFLIPPLIPSVRRQLFSFMRTVSFSYVVLSFFVVAFFFFATFLWSSAYQVGTLSLVSVASNAQPFFVLLLAWLLHAWFPRFAPRENVSMRSVQLKIGSFLIAFFGLALLSI